MSLSILEERRAKTQQLSQLLDHHLAHACRGHQARLEADASQTGALTGTLTALVEHHMARLDAYVQDLDRTESLYAQEQDDDIVLRGQIAEVALTLHETLTRTRERIIEVDGPDTLQIYGLQERPPRARHALVHYCRRTIDLMRAHPYTFQDQLGEQVDTRRVASFIEGLLAPLETLVSQMNHELDDLQEALRHRNEALERWSDTFHGLCTLLVGLFALVDLQEGVEQVRRLQQR